MHRYTHSCGGQRSTSYALPRVCVHTCVWVCTHKYTHTCGGQRSTLYATPVCAHTCVSARTQVHSYMWRPEVNLVCLSLSFSTCFDAGSFTEPGVNRLSELDGQHAPGSSCPLSPTPPLQLFTRTLGTLVQFLYPQSSLISRQDFLNKAKYFKTSESYKNNL